MKAAVYGQACNTYPDCEIVHVYAEEEFQRMLEDAKPGRFDMIIAESVFQFSEVVSELLKKTRDLRQHDVAVYFEKERIDTSLLNWELLVMVCYA